MPVLTNLSTKGYLSVTPLDTNFLLTGENATSLFECTIIGERTASPATASQISICRNICFGHITRWEMAAFKKAVAPPPHIATDFIYTVRNGTRFGAWP